MINLSYKNIMLIHREEDDQGEVVTSSGEQVDRAAATLDEELKVQELMIDTDEFEDNQVVESAEKVKDVVDELVEVNSDEVESIIANESGDSKRQLFMLYNYTKRKIEEVKKLKK